MTTPNPATDPPTVRHAIAEYLDQQAAAQPPDKVQVTAAALAALLGPALDEPITALTPLRLVLLGGTLKSKTSPKTGRPLAASTFRRYVLAAQEFYAWAAQKWPPEVPAVPAPQGPEGPVGQHLGDLIRILRTDAALSRAELAAATRIAEPILKMIELRRRLPTRRQLDRLTAAPAMQGLLEWAKREGIAIDLAPGDVGNVPGEDGGST